MVLTLLLGARAGHAQADDPTLGIWYSYAAAATFGTSPFGLNADAQVRNHRVDGDLDQLLLRGSLRYTVPDRTLTAGLGYAYIRSEDAGTPDDARREHRLFQEVVLPQRVLRASVSHRFRLETRWVAETPLQTRVRYNVGASVPLNAATVPEASVYAATSAEVFLRTSGRRAQPVFDRARVYAGLGYRFSPALALQAGLLGQVFEAHLDRQVQLSLHHTLRLR